MLVIIGGPAEKKANGLMIRLAPFFLRLVCKEGRGGTAATGEWDALDQLRDEAEANETIYAYRLVKNDGWIHLRMARGSGTYQRATYEFIPEQPDDGTMRSNKRWAEWCAANYEEMKKGLS